MRLASGFTSDGKRIFGRLDSNDRITPFAIDSAPAERKFSGGSVEIVRLAAPTEPANIFCIGRNYRKHAEETGSAVPEAPMIFMKPTTSVLAPNGVIRLPAAATSEVDFEVELAIVIGRAARNVSENDAADHVLGFTCANDVSARDCQRVDKQWSRAKGFDTFCPLGPWIVTPDAIAADTCAIRSRVNGQVMQESNTANMLHSWQKVVSYLSCQFTLLPGTLILTGTPEGVGMARNPPVFLKPGDTVDVEIEGIGTLKSQVAT